MPFDAEWFDELRGITADRLARTRDQGIARYVPNVGELHRDGHITERFLVETQRFVHMFRTPYQFDELFRAYPQHLANWPPRRAFRKQWNIGFTAGPNHGGDYVRLGIGFRLSARPEVGEDSILDYVRFQEQVRNHRAAFDSAFEPLGNYWEFYPERGFATRLSDMVIADNPPLESWRFFGRCLSAGKAEDVAVIGSHELFRDAAVGVFSHIQATGFGM
jgi:hypothetical protein